MSFNCRVYILLREDITLVISGPSSRTKITFPAFVQPRDAPESKAENLARASSATSLPRSAKGRVLVDSFSKRALGIYI